MKMVGYIMRNSLMGILLFAHGLFSGKSSFSYGREGKIMLRESIVTILLLSIVALILLQQMACEQSVEVQPVPEEISQGILPLKVGYDWEYKTYKLREDSSVGFEIDRAKFAIIQTSKHPSQIINDTFFHRVFINPYDNTQSEFEWLYRNFDDGLYTMGGKMPTDSIFTKILQLRYPVKKGETWRTPHLVYNLIERKYMIPDTITYTCVDTNVVFETPVGSFACIVYFHREKLDDDVVGKADIYEFYSKEIGLVGTVTNSFFESDQRSYPNSKKVLVGTNVITNKK